MGLGIYAVCNTWTGGFYFDCIDILDSLIVDEHMVKPSVDCTLGDIVCKPYPDFSVARWNRLPFLSRPFQLDDSSNVTESRARSDF